MQKLLTVCAMALLITVAAVTLRAEKPRYDNILYGAAYYIEYMPHDDLAARAETDARLMNECGINTVRIAESTWAVLEPSDGKFDFTKIDLVLDTMHRHDIHVIIGTPTYAIPPWMAKAHPEILATTFQGKNDYGPRQKMDITNDAYRRYAERVIRALVTHVRDHPAVIGYQADNETKHYGTAGENVMHGFVDYLRKKFGTVEAVNRAFGLNYWSNTLTSWDDFPPTLRANINASLGAEFSRYQRQLVTDYLAWQAALIRENARPDQFITHNFDLDWRGHSYGIQPDVDHFAAARAFDVVGIDIYHPTQDRLTGIEISLGGDLARSMKNGQNYFVLETQAQSIGNSTSQEPPYPGQLRLQAYSHLASGADMIEYWPWHSIHNAFETYWKGVLSHDMEPNPTYDEVRQISTEWKHIGTHLVGLQKQNKVALLFSNDSLTSLTWFPFSRHYNYNDTVRRLYDELYRLNIGCDLIDPSSVGIEKYTLIVVPPLYVASDALLERLNHYVENGGHVIYTMRSAVSNEHTQVRTTRMPGPLRAPGGFSYQQFTNLAQSLRLRSDTFKTDDIAVNYVESWAEFLTLEGATALATYDHPYWGKYAAITEHSYGKGMLTYIGAFTSPALTRQILTRALKQTNLWSADQELTFPLIVKHGTNRQGSTLHYYFNYSGDAQRFTYPHAAGTELISEKTITKSQPVTIPAWNLVIIEENEK